MVVTEGGVNTVRDPRVGRRRHVHPADAHGGRPRSVGSCGRALRVRQHAGHRGREHSQRGGQRHRLDSARSRRRDLCPARARRRSRSANSRPTSQSAASTQSRATTWPSPTGRGVGDDAVSILLSDAAGNFDPAPAPTVPVGDGPEGIVAGPAHGGFQHRPRGRKQLQRQPHNSRRERRGRLRPHRPRPRSHRATTTSPPRTSTGTPMSTLPPRRTTTRSPCSRTTARRISRRLRRAR